MNRAGRPTDIIDDLEKMRGQKSKRGGKKWKGPVQGFRWGPIVTVGEMSDRESERKARVCGGG